MGRQRTALFIAASMGMFSGIRPARHVICGMGDLGAGSQMSEHPIHIVEFQRTHELIVNLMANVNLRWGELQEPPASTVFQHP
jgi:hypothetical protein